MVEQRYRFDGALMRDLRRKAGLTQAGIAEQVGVGQTAVSQWEVGRVNPSMENLVRIAEILHCSPLELIETPTAA